LCGIKVGGKPEQWCTNRFLSISSQHWQILMLQYAWHSPDLALKGTHFKSVALISVRQGYSPFHPTSYSMYIVEMARG